MRFLPPDDDVTLYESVFEDDLLGRQKVSRSLSDILERIEDPLVVALDGRWGTGKSYFLKRWVGAHRLQNGGTALTIYFDAFAHDYLSDPLIALVGALSARMEAQDEPKLDRIKRAAIKFIKPAARLGIALATFGASQALNDLGDAAVEAVRGEADRAVEDFWKREEGRQAAMAEFRAAIETLTAPGEDGASTPLIIVIDELDRCRPDFALEVLEVIKHFFSVPRVHFVLGVNVKALENSVKARYGVEIDSTAYLQKFFSFSLRLPDHVGDQQRTPSIIRYAQRLGQSMAFPRYLLDEVHEQLSVLVRSNEISIRDVGKIMSTIALMPSKARGENVFQGWRAAAITLAITKVIRPDIFWSLVSSSISRDDLVGYLGSTNEFVLQELDDGSQNPNYSHEVYLLHGIWTYICQNGSMGNEKEQRVFAGLFDSFPNPHGAKRIPQRIFDEWLSVFDLGS